MTDYLWRCEGGCGQAFMLMLSLKDGRYVCPRCWARIGKPQLRALKSTYDQERETREHMIRRGGADRYRALAGKS